jgi:hypothetical protein
VAPLDGRPRNASVIDIHDLLDDVQKFERAIVSGKPFKTESARRRVVKKNDESAEDPNDSSDSGHDSTSEREPPKVVSCNLPLILSHSNPIRTTREGVSWHSYRIKARTTTDPYSFSFLIYFYDAVSSHHSLASRYL